MWSCPICMEDVIGSKCISLVDCEHYVCHDCFSEYCTINIKDGNINLKCPTHKCETIIHPSLLKQTLNQVFILNDNNQLIVIKTLLKEYYERWEDLTLKRALDTMQDISYCPKCNTVCIIESGNFSQCTKCYFAFCTSCLDAWHPGKY